MRLNHLKFPYQKKGDFKKDYARTKEAIALVNNEGKGIE